MNTLRLLAALPLSLLLMALIAAPLPAAEQSVYVEADGAICIEAEDVGGEMGQWKRHVDKSFNEWVGGFHGRGCLQFTGNNEASGPPGSVLTFFVLITNPGKYSLSIRALEAPLETRQGDKANDCYVRMIGQDEWRGKFTKHVLLGDSYRWLWSVKSEFAHHQFAVAEYELAAGIHALQVAGRSKNFFIDRIVLSKGLAAEKVQDAALAVSAQKPADIPAVLLAAIAAADAPAARPAVEVKPAASEAATGEPKVTALAGATVTAPTGEAKPPAFNPEKDLLLLHYDHAPDKDDGHSAAADRTMLMALHKIDWIKAHVVAVSGAYGINKRSFNANSDAVMDACWNDLGGWVAAHTNWDKAVETLVERTAATLAAGGDVWVKEGGQSDITAAVIKQLKAKMPDLNTVGRIHVVQHSTWNEQKTTPEALAYTKANSHYIRIQDANRYLNVKGGDETFVKAALAHATAGAAWKAALDYYKPTVRLDFSDTGELMHILGLGEIGIDDFRKRYLEPAPPAAEAAAPAVPAAEAK